MKLFITIIFWSCYSYMIITAVRIAITKYKSKQIRNKYDSESLEAQSKNKKVEYKNALTQETLDLYREAQQERFMRVTASSTTNLIITKKNPQEFIITDLNTRETFVDKSIF